MNPEESVCELYTVGMFRPGARLRDALGDVEIASDGS